jgi:sarcosine oxidase subunit gamma
VANLTHQTLAQMLGRPATVFTSPKLTVALVAPVYQAYLSGSPDEKALGMALPHEPNHMTGETTRALWIAPDRWLIVADMPLSLSTIDGAFVSDITDGLAVFDLSGPAARQLLAMGCSLDVEGDALAPGRCARTLFAGVDVILYSLGSHDRFRIHVERSMASYLCDWLEKAATGIA